MHRLALVAALALAACRSGRPSEPVPPVPDPTPVPDPIADPVVAPDPGASVGGPGTVCALGRMNQDPKREAHACNPGLSCCYPCGIDGCDSVCMADCGPPRP